MKTRPAVVCETLEQRSLLSVTPTIETDLLAVRAARAALTADHAADVTTIHADNAAIPAAVANIGASIKKEENILHIRLQNDLERVSADEVQGPMTIAADQKAVHNAQVHLELDEKANLTTKIAADQTALSTAQRNLSDEQTRAAENLANDKAALVKFKQDEGAQVLSTKLTAINAVQAAKAKFISDEQQSVTTWHNDSQALAAALVKLRIDAKAGL